MSVEINLRPKPEDAELNVKRQELQGLENQLIERELYMAGLRGELAAFEKVYLRIVGTRYAELDEIEAQIAEFRARHEPKNADAQDAARDARTRAQESRASSTKVAPLGSGRFSPSPSLKNLYREVARRIHPDLATNEVDRARRQKLMAEANLAYEAGDEVRLRAILEEYESSPDSVFGDSAGAELVRVIRKIAQVKRRLAEIDEEVKRMMKSDVFELKTKVEEGKQRGRDILNEMAAAVGVRIDEAKAVLKEIQGR